MEMGIKLARTVDLRRKYALSLFYNDISSDIGNHSRERLLRSAADLCGIFSG